MAPPHRVQAFVLFAALLIIYNANGRESGSVDTQPAKFLAAEIALHHTLTLNDVVNERPGLAERTAFMRDRRGDWRPAYPILPGLIAAVPAVVLHILGLVQMDAPLAPNLVAKLTASCLTAAAVAFVFISLTRVVNPRHAMLTAIGLGLGTNYWAGVSQTLGGGLMVAFGLSLVLWGWWRTTPLTRSQLMIGAIGLAMAGVSRPQVAPMLLVLLAGLFFQIGWRRMAWPLALIAAVLLIEISRNILLFGHPLGGAIRLEAVHPAVHGVTGMRADHPWVNAVALLISPSRGLLIYSPVAAVALIGVLRGWRMSSLRWYAGAIALQFEIYAAYSVWWGGHTFGPRYLLDVLVLMAPFGALGVAYVASRPAAAAASLVLLAWSVTVSALGAFVFPNDRWNTNPSDVDRNHERLWDWGDLQILRAWRGSASPQNYDLFTRPAVRRDLP